MIECVAVRAVEMYRRRSFYHDTNAPNWLCYTNSARGLGGPFGRRGLVLPRGGCSSGVEVGFDSAATIAVLPALVIRRLDEWNM
jgi:hypothetical protein